MTGTPRALRLVSLVLLTSGLVLGGLIAPAAAQYGGISGLFLITSPDTPHLADFNGMGCTGGDEVVLYLPGIAPTPDDPVASTLVTGRILSVSTVFSGTDPLVNGTFLFDDVVLPTDLEPGFYEFHSRCGDLDLSVVGELAAGGGVRIVTPSEYIDRIGNVPEAIPFTGRRSSELVSLAAALVTAGLVFIGVNRRSERARTDA